MNVLVTGANGFIGRHLVRTLSESGHQVTALVRRQPTPTLEGAGVKLAWADLENTKALQNATKNQQIIVHLAGLTTARNLAEFMRVNAEGTERLLEAAQKTPSHIQRFVYVSSLAAVGPSSQGQPANEKTPCQPISNYGISKQAGEAHVERASQQLPTLILRPPIVYGPWESQLYSFFKLAKKGICPLLSGQEKRYSVIYVEDFVQAICSLIAKEPSHRVYHLNEAKSYTWNEIVTTIATNVKPKTWRVPIHPSLLRIAAWGFDLTSLITNRPLSFGSQKYVEFAAPNWTSDSSLAKKDFGFETTVDLTTGIQKTTEWYREKGWL